jgi:lantibiotic modifying enzyme
MSVQIDVKETALGAARRIGRELCESAFWDADHRLCTWMGRTDVEDSSGAGYASATAALGAHVYAGASGVALFLAELYGITQDAEAARTAEAALRRAVAFLRTHEAQTSPLSFHLSHVGVAYAISRAQDFGLCADLNEDAVWLVEQATGALTGEHLLDTLGGNAGAVPALLALARRRGFEHCLELARACGEDLCRTAVRDGEVCFWEAKKASGPAFTSPPMTGLSHGACGMALALFELYAQTGEPEFLRTARAAFAYEDLLFNPALSNWIDVRFPYTDYGGLNGSFQTSWCHGAPGIGLTRLRAAALDPEQSAAHEQKARAALATTIAAIEQNLQAPRFDATLCHGLAGLSEIVLIYAETFDDDGCREVATGATGELIRRYAETNDWPCGNMTGGVNPTLMIGVSGIGHHLLRLHAPRAVAPLLIIESTRYNSA